MHASCSICGDIFTGVHPEVVHTTNCGHIFHYECLLEWLQRSKTCPHCRNKVNEKSTIRLYFQLSAGVSQDTGTLENKIQSLTFQLAIKETDFKKISEEAKLYKEQNKGLRDEVLKSEEKIRNNETIVSSLQDQVHIMKSQMKSLKRTQARIVELEEKLEQYQSLEKILKGSVTESAETLELMKNITDTSALCACINTLKREIYTLKEASRNVQYNLKSKESKIVQMNVEISRLQEQLSILIRSLNKVKDDLSASEAENDLLRSKCEMFQKISNDNPGTSFGSTVRQNYDLLKSKRDKLQKTLNDNSVSQNSESSSDKLASSQLSKHLSNVERVMSNKSLLKDDDDSDLITFSPVKSKFLNAAASEGNKLLLNKRKIPSGLKRFSNFDEEFSDGLGGHGSEDSFFNKEKSLPLFFPDKSKKVPSKGQLLKKLKSGQSSEQDDASSTAVGLEVNKSGTPDPFSSGGLFNVNFTNNKIDFSEDPIAPITSDTKSIQNSFSDDELADGSELQQMPSVVTSGTAVYDSVSDIVNSPSPLMMEDLHNNATAANDSFHVYRYDDPFTLPDDFHASGSAIAQDSSGNVNNLIHASEPANDAFFAYPTNQSLSNNGLSKSTPVSPLPSEDQQLVWAKAESIKLEQERQKQSVREKADLELALRLSKSENKKKGHQF